MPDKINIWMRRLDQLSSAFNSEFGHLSIEELNWKPNPQVWSIAQIIEHLINTTASYLPVINKARLDNYKIPLTAKIPGFPTMMGRIIYKSVHPDNRRKSKTLKVWEPDSGTLPKEMLDQFFISQNHLKQLIQKSVNLIENKTIISSPANKFIVYELEMAFEILVTHEERHLIQARELKSLLLEDHH